MRTTEDQAEIDLLKEQVSGLEQKVKDTERALRLALQVAEEAMRLMDDTQLSQMRVHLEGGDDGPEHGSNGQPHCSGG